MTGKTKVAILGSGNIGTDRMIKLARRSKSLEMGVLVGVDPEDGLARARPLNLLLAGGALADALKNDMPLQVVSSIVRPARGQPGETHLWP